MGDLLSSMPARRYERAHGLHYGSKDLHGALELYLEVLAVDIGTPEAGYARSQVDNIVRAVVPDLALLDAQVELAREHLQQVDTARRKPSEVRP